MLREMWLRHDPSLRMIAPLAVLAVVVIGVLNISILALGAHADRQSAAWEMDLIGAGMNARFNTILQGEAEMLARMDPLDPVVPPGSMRIMVLGADGAPLSNRTGPTTAALPTRSFLRIGVPAIEGLKNPRPLSPLAAPRRVGSTVIPTGASIAWVNGEAEMVMAVRTIFPEARARGMTIVATTSLTDMVNTFGNQRHVQELGLVALGGPKDAEYSVAPLKIMSLPPVVGVQWQPRRIGHETIARSLPVIWGVTLMLLLAGLLLVRRTLRLAQSLIASEAHAHHLALHDPMTGLANRALFTDRLEHAIEQRGRSGALMAVACIDLDRFKHVNDTLGHQAGDAMIKEAARRLTNVTRASDTVARIGGDEFALILHPVADRAGLEALCARLTHALCARLDLPSGSASLSASIGVTLVGDGVDGADAIRQADLALYRAKQEGRGRFALFEAEMDESLKLRHEIEADLRIALSQGGLRVHYQPQYTSRGVLEGVEALVRWTHPTRGVISPAYFIPIAEEAGLINWLGEFVLAEAIAAAARWPKLRVAINVSPVQLHQSDFAALCSTLVKQHGVEPSHIELEITEGVLLENEPRIQNTLRTLREIGFKIALDDFGTGYSSLSYLNVYPVDKIKIDRSFVSNLGVDADADKVVRAIIRLGRALGLSVTAEGVETEAQRAKLVAAGCHSLQGYLHGHPDEPAVIDELLLRQSLTKAA